MAEQPDVLRVEHIAKRFGARHGAARRQPHLQQGRGARPAGRQRRRQVDAGQDHLRLPEARLRPDRARGEPVELHRVDHARSLGIDTVYQDLALIDELSRLPQHVPAPGARTPTPLSVPRTTARCAREAREALDDIGVNIPRLNMPVARLSGGQRQAIAVARTRAHGGGHPAARRAARRDGRQGGRADPRPDRAAARARRRLDHHGRCTTTCTCFRGCDRVNLIQDGVIALDKPTSETSVEELTEIVVERVPARRAGETAMAAEAYVIGVDFGTLSGRAVVVRATDGAELGSAVHEYPHGVIERDAACRPARRCRRSGRCRTPADWVEVLRTAVPAALRPPASTPTTSSGSAPTSRPRRRCRCSRDGTPLCRLPTVSPTRPHAYPKLWKHHAAQAPGRPHQRARGERGEPWLDALRRQDLLRVGVRQGAAGARGGPRGLRAHGALGRGRRLDRLAALRRRDAQRVHRGLQGHLPGRPLPVRGLPARARPRLRRLRRDKLERPAVRARRPRRRPHARRRPSGPGCPQGIAVAVGNVDAHVTAPAAQAIAARADGRDHGHLDLPRDERRRARRGARHVRRRARRDRARPVRATRPARAASATSSAGSSSTSVPPRYHDEARERGIGLHDLPLAAGRRAGARRARAGRARLAQRQPLGARRPRAQRADRRA